MGVFDCACVESGLIIQGDQQLIVIVEVAKARWSPVALPIAGTYNRYGTMDVPSKLDPAMKAVATWGKRLTYEDESSTPKKADLEAMLDEIRGDGSGARLGKQAVSFSLVDGRIYRAIVGAVAEGGATAWRRYAQLALAIPEPPLPGRNPSKAQPPVDATTERLAKDVLGAPADDGPRKVLLDHLLERNDPHAKLLSVLPALGKIKTPALLELALPDGAPIFSSIHPDPDRAALLDFVRFLAWGTTFQSTSGEGQFCGYEGKDDWFVNKYNERARAKYADMPELLAAVDANEAGWRELDEENEE